MEANITGAILALIARFLSGASVRWIDCQPDTCQRVYFANHTSHLDALVIWSALPSSVRTVTRPVAAKDYWTAGPVRRYLSGRVFNALLIDRTEIKVHQSPVDLMIREIGDQHSLIVFPEGGRSSGPEMRRVQERAVLPVQEAAGLGADPGPHRQHEPDPPPGRGAARAAVDLHQLRTADVAGSGRAESGVSSSAPARPCDDSKRCDPSVGKSASMDRETLGLVGSCCCC